MNKKLFLNELIRQSFHLFCGIIGIINLKISFIPIWILFILQILAITIFLTINYLEFIKKHTSTYLKLIERPKVLAGQGVLTLYSSFFILSIILYFWQQFETKVLVTMTILAFSDSISTIIGITTKKLSLPYNRKKNLVGVFAGIFAGSAASSFFINPFLAILVTSITMFIESLDIKIMNIKIDDNLLVPFCAFVSMFLVGLL